MIARALAQQTPVIFFDEPTANLDVPHQLEVMELVQKLALGGKCILTAIHDLSMAVRFASRVVILVDGRLVENGIPGLVLTESKLEEHFKIISRSLEDDQSGIPFILPIKSCYPAQKP